MGDHDTWYTLLPFWHDLEQSFEEGLRRDWQVFVFQETHFTLLHVGSALVAFVFLVFVGLRYRASLRDETKGVVPSRRFTLAAMVDSFIGACYKFSAGAMGEEDAKKFLPFIATLALFIFCCNIQGLIPGLLPATDTLKTNLALALIVFLVYNAVGVWRNGLDYLAHFLGPKFPAFGANGPWLAPLMLPIELVSHIARPISLSLRLMCNILADHKVVITFAGLVALIVPVPFLILGVLVACVQTAIFTLLTIAYIGMALEHAEEH